METKFCVDCKYVKKIGFGYWCRHPSLLLGLVTKDTYSATTCLSMRHNSIECGPNGKLFEQKVTLWQHVKQLTKTC